MFQSKAIVKFLAIFLVSFIVLIVPWLGLRGPYASLYRGMGNALFGTFSSVATIRFEPLPKDDPAAGQGSDIQVTFRHRETGTVLPMAASTRFQGFTPTAFVIALALAAPLKWPRRVPALLLSFVAVTVYIAFRQYILIASVIYKEPAWVAKLLDFAYWVFVESFAGVFVVPLIIWAAVTFRRSDFDRIRLGPATTNTARPG